MSPGEISQEAGLLVYCMHSEAIAYADDSGDFRVRTVAQTNLLHASRLGDHRLSN